MFHRYSLLFGLSVTLSLATIIEVKAQLVPDNTLGKENSIVNHTKLLQRIDGGAIRGSNLFHSFKEFNIDSGKSVYFNNPSAIENILTRVTGKNPSSIFGKLGVLGNANLFLMNPNGIIFGKGASLDISGSFSATTSTSILFNNNFEFSATNPQAVPLLKVNLTPDLQYPRSQQGDITNQGNLTVGNDLNLIGKNLDLTGQLNSGRDLNLKAQNNLKIRDNSNNAFVADAGSDLFLQANQAIDIFALNHPDSGLFSGNDLILLSENPVIGDARYFSGGSFRIEQLDGSLGDLESPNDPIIRASGDVSFDSYEGASLHILAGGSVNITGDVTITGADGENGLQETVTLSDGESLEIDGKNQATLDIRAGTTAFGIEGVSGSASFTPGNPNTGGSGSSRDIVIGGSIIVYDDDSLVFLSNQYNADSSLSGGNIRVEGDIDTWSEVGGGRILIDSKGDINTQSLKSYSFSSSQTSGNGGDIALTAGGDITTLSLDSSSLSSSDKGNSGNGGDISITAGGGNITTSQSLKSYSLSDGNSGNGGAISITADDGNITTLSLDSSSYSSSDGGSSENGGAITLIAGGDITTNKKLDSSSFSPDGSSKNGGAIAFKAGGNIKTSESLNSYSFSDKVSSGKGGAVALTAGGDITTSSLDSSSLSFDGSSGNGGAISITADDGNITTLSLDSSSISFEGNSGNGGAIALTAGGNIKTSESLDSSSFSYSFSDKVSSGNGGAIALKAGGDIKTSESLDSSSSSFGGNSGNGGKILLEANNGIAVETIVTSSSKNSGNIDIKTKAGSFSLENSSISSNAIGDGDAGDIKIEALSIELTQSDITSSVSGTGNSGNISLNSVGVIYLDNSRLFTTMEPGATGEEGNIQISTQKLQLENYSLINTGTYGSGNAGDVKINAQEVLLNNSSNILSLTSDAGNAGNINLNVSGKVALTNNSNISTASTLKSTGNSGDISIKSNQLLLTEGSQLQALTEGTGNSGDININVVDIVDISGVSNNGNISGIFTSSKGENSGEGGDLTINTRSLNINNGGVLNAQNFSTSSGGNITINADTVSLENGGQVLADTNGEGKAGEVTINATKYINIFGVDSEFENRPLATTSREQNVPGKISSCNESGECQKLPEGQGIFSTNSNDDVEFSTRIPYVSVEGTGDDSVDYYAVEIQQSGTRAVFDFDSDIDFDFVDKESKKIDPNTKLTIFDSNKNELADNDNSSISLGGLGSESKNDPYLRYAFNKTGTYFIKVSTGDGGGIPSGEEYALQISLESPAITGITAKSGAASGIFASSKGTGEAGTININTPQLNIADVAQVTVSSQGNSSAGNLFIDSKIVNINNQARIAAETQSGVSGNIQFNNVETLQLNQGSQISASTVDGKAGDITINSTDSIQLKGGSNLSSEAISNGNAGNLTITTPLFTISDNSKASVSSQGSGNAGNLLINALDVNLYQNAKISGTTESGIGGDITLEDNSSLTLNNSEISASTIDGEAGNLEINATDSIELTGKGGLSVQSTNGGIAGSITVNASKFSINDEAQVTVSSPTGQAGNLDITADNLFLNRGSLTADTGAGDGSKGANMTLGIKDLLLMRNNSLISAEAFDTANGGNITIKNSQGFIIASPFENNDIIANANQGNGGNINITTKNIFGLVSRDKITPKSDITASSQFGLNGEVTVDQLNINPASGLVELPSTLVGTTGIKAGCAASNGNNFVVSGKGGLPQSPDDLFTGETTLTDLFDLVTTEESSSEIRNENNNVNVENPKNKIVEATGWIVDDEGSVIFVAKMPEDSSQNSVVYPVDCENFSAVSK